MKDQTAGESGELLCVYGGASLAIAWPISALISMHITIIYHHYYMGR